MPEHRASERDPTFGSPPLRDADEIRIVKGLRYWSHECRPFTARKPHQHVTIEGAERGSEQKLEI